MVLVKKRSIEVPDEGGWEPHTFYAVLVSVSPNNPIWGAILYTGFLNGPDGGPGGYASVWNGGTDESTTPFHRLHYLKILHKLDVPARTHVSENDLPRLLKKKG